MSIDPFIAATILGLVEGITEFIPVSSTGHLIVVSEWLNFTGPEAKTFDIFIQLGAILAVVWLYREKLFGAVVGWRRNPADRRLLVNLGIAFLPAAIVGFLTHEWIKAYLFRPLTVGLALVVGGGIILLVERWPPRVTTERLDDVPYRTALGIGLAQVLSLFPGTSRSGATIIGAYALGLSRPAATEFSFFLAIPVMVAATLFDLFQSRDALTPAAVPVFAVGFLVSFVSAVVIVRGFLAYVSRHSFVAFAWYRIVFGVLLLAFILGGR